MRRLDVPLAGVLCCLERRGAGGALLLGNLPLVAVLADAPVRSTDASRRLDWVHTK
jgi:hypothetical protein